MVLVRRRSRVYAICVSVVATLAATAGVASANPFSGAQLTSGVNSGMSATLQFVNLNTPNNTLYHSLDHIWVSNGNLSSNPLYWVETGATIGYDSGTNGSQDFTSPEYDWENANVNGIFIHTGFGPASYNTYFTAQILYDGNGNWSVNDNGYTATAINASFSASTYALAFGETNSSGGKICAHDSSLMWYDVNGVGHSGFSSLTGSNPPVYSNWTSQPTAVRAYANESSSC